jgi:hypothetical protein
MVALVAVEIWVTLMRDLMEISVGEIVWSAREWWYGHVTSLEVRKDHSSGVFSVGLTRFKLWAGKIFRISFPRRAPQYNFAFCGCVGCAGGDVVICWRSSRSRLENATGTKKGANGWKCEYEHSKHPDG